MRRGAAAPASLPAEARLTRRGLIELGLGAAYLMAGAGVVHIVDSIMTLMPMGKAVIGAVAIDIVARRAGVDLDLRRVPRQIAIGFAFALAAVVAIVGVGFALGWAEIAAGAPSITVVFGMIRAVSLGWRDELLLRAIPLHAAKKAGVPTGIAMLFSALAGAFALAATDVASPPAFALAIALGWGFALICVRLGPFTAIAAHGALAFLLGPGLRGSVLDVNWTRGLSLVLGSRAAGPTAWLATAVVIVLAIAGALYRSPAERRGSAPARVL